MKPYTALAVQTRPRFGAIGENVEAALALAARHLEREPADLVVLPELFSTGYAFLSRREALSLAQDARRGPTVRRLHEFARDYHTHVVAGIAERDGRRAFNSAVALGPRGVLGVYRKVHLYDREKLCFAPGTAPWPVFRMGAARVGVLICFDWRFPEVARALTLAGAEVLAHPSNLVTSLAPDAMRTRTLENAVFGVTANRVGEDRRPGLTVRFTGQSQIVDARGRVLGRASRSRPGVVAAELDLGLARDKRVNSRNHLLRDRVPRLYAALARSRPTSRPRASGGRRTSSAPRAGR